MIDLNNILFKRYCDALLAHFYIIEAPTNTEHPEKFLKCWMNDFLKKVLHKERNITDKEAENILLNGHSDILEIKKDNANDQYVIDDFAEFLHFQNYYNFELPHRFAIIHNAQNITKIVANKLLKTLEEPTPGTTIFFLKSNTQNLMPTIESRAIKLKINKDNDQHKSVTYLIDEQEKLKWLEKELENRNVPLPLKESLTKFLHGETTTSEITTLIARDKELQKILFKLIVDYQSSVLSNFSSKQKILNEIIWFEKAQTFNNSAWERFLGLLTTIYLPLQSLKKSGR